MKTIKQFILEAVEVYRLWLKILNRGTGIC